MKYGLSLKDLTSNINWFSKVEVDGDGNLSYVPGHSKAGDYVDLQGEMDTLVVLNTCPHPLDPGEDYAPKALELTLWRSDIKAEDNPCRTSCEQNQRGFTNTIRYNL